MDRWLYQVRMSIISIIHKKCVCDNDILDSFCLNIENKIEQLVAL